MNQNLNDAKTLLDIGVFLVSLKLLDNHDPKWVEVRKAYENLRLRSVKDLENQQDHNGGRNEN